MTKGAAFLLVMLIEGAVAAVLGAWLHRRLGFARFGAGSRAGAAAIIATGATHPLQWMLLPPLLAEVDIRWQSVAILDVAAVLVETLFYAAVLRGHWRWSLGLSIVVNAIGLGVGYGFSGAIATGS